ncbi:MAG: undecaprenyl-diphosphate phosphatase [Gammaproteobacteria bacterium]|nr:undecaprenyl-diphosphate phosphatase [Gammaproteobacteria bacterium]
MDFIAAIMLALLQGLTEFLPISSSAHLILLPRILGWEDQGLAFDVAVHLGTLAAVLWYFREEVASIIRAFLCSLVGRPHAESDAHLGWMIILATLPVVVVGFLAEDFVEHQLRSPLVIAFATAIFGVVLWLSDLRSKDLSDEHNIGLRVALLIGLAQVLALIPGTSRSGITISAGLALGLSRQTAARFSFLLSMPTIAGAAVFELADAASSPVPIDWTFMLVGLLVSAISAYFCIRLFLSVIERIGMLPFMLYRLALAAVLIWLFI